LAEAKRDIKNLERWQTDQNGTARETRAELKQFVEVTFPAAIAEVTQGYASAKTRLYAAALTVMGGVIVGLAVALIKIGG
jgi:hypothetical protein